ncbi:phosphoesterase [Gemmata sp. G18]|uniref:Phosphoesterase n=1 Tax=Gemmata palustris TaxID=2822762 RepID=A0ABS5BLM8_9BACT|nr:phosphoesterase [Gemmata palustris]MBP3954614.1 phosphoesterase [Gemmata palustris]
MPLDEKVLVIPTEQFRAAGYFHGLRAADDAFRATILDATAFQFRPRYEVETDPSFKQLIPYIVLKCGDQLFHYRRGAAGTEKRLEALRSIGIGGHISEADAVGGDDPYQTGMLRELTEEVELGCGFRERCVGFINDDRTPVGSVHLGVVHVFELESPAARSREDALVDSGFAPLAELLRDAEHFETWSQFALEELRSDTQKL